MNNKDLREQLRDRWQYGDARLEEEAAKAIEQLEKENTVLMLERDQARMLAIKIKREERNPNITFGCPL